MSPLPLAVSVVVLPMVSVESRMIDPLFVV